MMDDFDRGRFVETLAEACEKSAWEVYPWVLLDNHYPSPCGRLRNLVEGMKWFQNTILKRCSLGRKRIGGKAGRFGCRDGNGDGGVDRRAAVRGTRDASAARFPDPRDLPEKQQN